MRITNQQTTINFSSVHKADAVVLKKKRSLHFPNEYTSKRVSIVEFIPSDKADQNTIHKVVKYWNDMNNDVPYFANGILFNFENETDNKKHKRKKQRFFAIETNNKEEEYKKILCLAEFDESPFRYNKIKWLQLNPKYAFQNNKNRNYKNIGSEMVEYLKSISTKPIEVFSAISAIEFYKKLGFQHIFGKSSTYFIYKY